jgi:hypothetical protein
MPGAQGIAGCRVSSIRAVAETHLELHDILVKTYHAASHAPQNRSLRRGSVQRLLGRCRNVVKTPEELRPRHRFTASGSCRRQRVTVDVRGEPHQSRGGHPSENVQYAGPAEVDDHDVPAAADEVLRSRDEACAGQYSGNLRAIDEIGRVRHCLNHGDLPVWVVPTLCSQLPHRREIRCHLGQGADGVGQHGPKAAATRAHEFAPERGPIRSATCWHIPSWPRCCHWTTANPARCPRDPDRKVAGGCN